ncbi:hypothetical protein [Tateyamaria sp. ANG-S1]|uniref:COG4223 family protein n=1 Tax=Tateyamaria sp. ANG-S1 TaxID=1577905 RepID=UPI0006908F78|nr:hypothetical protein [Tateyamaria sp. ANG-S1]
MAKRKSPEKGPQKDTAADNTDAADPKKIEEATQGTDLTPDVAATEAVDLEAEDVDPKTATDDAKDQDELIVQAEPEPEPENVVAPPPPQPQPERRSALPLVFAGVITALAGFIAGRTDILDPIFPPRATADPELVAELNNTVADLSAQLNEATSDISLLRTQVQDQSGAAPTDLGPLEQQIADLTGRIDALADRPATGAVVPDEAIDAALADLRGTAAAQQEEIDRLLSDARLARENADAAASATLARAAMNRVMAAVDNGGPFAAPLGDLQQAGVSDIPEVLRTTSADGVQPLSALQASIPDAARDALSAARQADGSGGLGAFFERQLGTRSILPQEGSDPDAVLSRIEAATRDGRLGDALAETDALPDAAKAALGPWLEQAQLRHDAVTAANALAQRLSAL